VTIEQIYVFAVILGTLGLFIWGRWRYDVVALIALVAVLLGGIVPPERAFEGFGHPAVITVAAVLVISRGLQNSGIVGFIAKRLAEAELSPSLQVGAIAALVAALSGFMNNIGALALLMPVVIQIARKSGREPRELLMPLSFGSLLGGLVTLIGDLGLSPDLTFLLMMLIPLILCMFIDQIAFMLLAVPIYQPIVAAMGFDPIWFWTLFLINLTVGSLTPPFGYTLFALKSAAEGMSTAQVYRAAWPVVGIFLVGMGLLWAFPSLVTAIPEAFR